MKYYLTSFCLLILVLLSCNKEEDINSSYINSKTFEFIDRVILPIDSVTKRNSQNVGYIADKNTVYLFNEINYNTYFFDLSTKSVSRKIKIMKNGPNGVGEVDKIIVSSMDTIIVFNRQSNRVYLITDQGENVKPYQVFSFTEPDPSIQTFSTSVDFENKSKMLFLPIRANSRTSDIHTKTLFTFDLLTREKQFLMKWPESYSRFGTKGMTSEGAMSGDRKNYIFSYSFDEYIYIMNLKTKKITKKYAGSTKVEKPKFYKNKGRGMMESPVYQMSNSWYGDIYYDQYRKLYYRSASIGREIPDSELNPMANLKLYKSLNNDDIYALTIILDENFKKVGEVYGIRLTKRSFATESNLLIEDSKYDSENEDIIVFKRYNINNIDNEIR